jgi:hypothetical protein
MENCLREKVRDKGKFWLSVSRMIRYYLWDGGGEEFYHIWRIRILSKLTK